MNGTILHFDAAEGGTVRGADGNRYAFAAAEWKSDTPPAVGDTIDFEVDGETARSVYAIPPATAAPAAPAPAPRPGLFFADRPGLPFAAAILIACFLPFISMGFVSVNLFDLVSLANMMGNFTPGVGSIQTGLWLFYFLYAVPLVAIWVLVQEFRRAATGSLRFGGGLFCLAGPFAIVIGATELMKAGLPARRGAGELNLNLISGMSVGWILLAVAAAGLIAVGTGWRPFGEGSDDHPEDAF